MQFENSQFTIPTKHCTLLTFPRVLHLENRLPSNTFEEIKIAKNGMFVSILHVFEPKETSHLVLERGLVQGQRLMKCYYKIDWIFGCAKIIEIGNYWLEIYLRESWIEGDITSIVRACQCSYPTSIRL